MYKNNLPFFMGKTKHSFRFLGRSVALWKRGKNWSIWMKIDNKDLKQSLGVDTVHEAVRAAKKLHFGVSSGFMMCRFIEVF